MTQASSQPQQSSSSQPFAITQGVWPVMPTTFLENGEVDLSKIPSMVDFYLKAGCAGIFAVAGSGEMFQLSHPERLEVARATIKAVNGRSQVLAGGNFGPDMDTQVEEVRQMAATGVDVVVLILSTIPLQTKPWNGDELTERVLELASKVDCRLGMYECPSPEHRTLRPQDVKKIAATGKFHFLKETTEERDNVAAKVSAAEGTPLKIFPASMRVFLQERIPGVGGFNGIIANVIPEVMVKIDRLGKESLPFSQEIADEMDVLEHGFLNHLYPASGKVLLNMRGLSLGIRARAGQNPILNEQQLADLAPMREKMEKLLAKV